MRKQLRRLVYGDVIDETCHSAPTSKRVDGNRNRHSSDMLRFQLARYFCNNEKVASDHTSSYILVDASKSSNNKHIYAPSGATTAQVFVAAFAGSWTRKPQPPLRSGGINLL